MYLKKLEHYYNIYYKKNELFEILRCYFSLNKYKFLPLVNIKENKQLKVKIYC